VEALLRQSVSAQPPSYRARITLAGFYLQAEHPNLAAAEATARDAVKLALDRTYAYGILASIYSERANWSELDSVLVQGAQRGSGRFVSSVSSLPHYRAAERLITGVHNLDLAENICGCTWARSRKATVHSGRCGSTLKPYLLESG
jgi:hypothetical protein